MSDLIENIHEKHGLFRNVPRTIRRSVKRRLARLEADESALDREALAGHAKLKRLYALLHVKPGERAEQTLFGKPPPGSARAALALLARTRDAAVASGLVRK